MKVIKKAKPHYWDKSKKFLRDVDPVLSKIIDKHKDKTHLTSKYTAFQTFFKIQVIFIIGCFNFN